MSLRPGLAICVSRRINTIYFLALAFSWALQAAPSSELTCSATPAGTSVARAEGLTEPLADVVLTCTGGEPTAPGSPIPEYGVQLSVNTNLTNRRLFKTKLLSDALVSIDEPSPASPSPPPPYAPPPAPGNPPQILCTPLGSTCNETGTGGVSNPYATQPNVFVGKETAVNVVEWRIPIDPPGPSATRVIRFTNIRANVFQLGVSSMLIPTQIMALVAIAGTPSLPIEQPAAGTPVATVIPGAFPAASSTASLHQCQPHNAALLGGKGTAAFDFTVGVEEGFAAAFKYRNMATFLDGPQYPPAVIEQNLSGFDGLFEMSTETGFYSPSLFTPAPTLGLADFGTRLLIKVSPISPGTHLFVPTTITLTGQYGEGVTQGQLQLVEADENGKSEPRYQPVPSTETIGTTPVAKAEMSGSTAYAVYEVIYSNPNVLETATIPIAVAFKNQPETGLVKAITTLAPQSDQMRANDWSAVPRFGPSPPNESSYSITSCSAQESAN